MCACAGNDVSRDRIFNDHANVHGYLNIHKVQAQIATFSHADDLISDRY